MSLAITWSPNAEEDYAELLAYLDEEYGYELALKFMDKLDSTISNIQRFPKMYPQAKRKRYRKAVLSKQTSLIYSVHDKEIHLVRFESNFMES